MRGISAARRARGPLAWYAAGVSITWLLEPAAISTVPTAMLALGVACATGPDPDPPPADRRARLALTGASVALALYACYAGIRLIRVDHLLLKQANGAPAVDAARTAVRLLPRDPEVADAYTQSLDGEAYRVPNAANRAVVARAAQAATRTDPTWAHLWNNVGLVEEENVSAARRERLQAAQDRILAEHPDWFSLKRNLALLWDQVGKPPPDERLDTARAAFARAQRISPWSVTALTNLYLIDRDHGRVPQSERWRDKLCEIGPTYCPPRE